ncbi:sushi domain-containing protein 5 [Elgaria multicarinata webbii]|uniref:sushi domain-containing protein 5 n=1 Tax=Elgaria multicarinata webbii TaxID=159646 RepID=UPI002FCCE077
MAPASKKWPVTFVQCVGSAFFLLQVASVKADGKLFALGPRNGSQNLDLAMAQQSCAAGGAHLASAEELRRAIRDCSFVICTRGWLADGSIGTTVCNRTGSRPQSVKVIDIQIEMDPSPSGRYDALCVKAEGKPCGDPPSFPHTVLHGHTGFEMGDELHYVCAQGYVMSNKDTAFTLLCHTCGEWFGQVQACVKDETEVHIDYEDNFPDDRSMPTEEHDAKETEEKEPEKATDNEKTQFAYGDNHIGVKTMYNEQGIKMLYEGEDFPMGPTIVNNDTKAAKSTDTNTDESWLDGYPVTQEAEEEEGDKIDGSMGMEDDITTDQSNYVGVRKTGGSSLEKDFIQTGAAPPLTKDDEIKRTLVTLLPTSGTENISISKGSDNVISYAPTTPMVFVTQELASVTTVTNLNLATLETSTVLHLVDHIQLPEEEEIMTSPMQAVTTVPSQNSFTDTSADAERETLTYGLGGKPLTTFEPCIGGNCSSPDKGSMVAIGVTLVCLLSLAAILAVWCFKKRQHKTSVYKLNGKEHTRHQLQQIEMQKV